MPDSVHAPWALIVLIALGAGTCFYIANARLDHRLKRMAVTLLIFAAALAAIRLFFPTNIEQVEQSTRELCQAAVDANWTRFKSFLSPDVTIGPTSPRAATVQGNPDDVTAAAKATYDAQHVTLIKITGMESTQSGDTITTLCKIISLQDSTSGQPVDTTWSMEWRRSARLWLLDRVTLISVGGESPANFPEVGRLRGQ